MTDRELVIELLNRIAKYHAEKNAINYNNVQYSSADCIEIGNRYCGEDIEFLFKDDKIIGIAC